jgi:hypothetical protein
MKCPLTAFIFLSGEQDVAEIAAWNDRTPNSPLILTAHEPEADVYVYTGLASDVADEKLDQEVFGQAGWRENRPVIWLAAGASFYIDVPAFKDAHDTGFVSLLQEVYGEVRRSDLLDQLSSAQRTLNDASSVADAGESEAHAYEHEMTALGQLIARLERGAFITDP